MQKMIPLNKLRHTDNNVRKVSASKDGIKRLAASIESQGILHNLVVKPNGSGFIVIDGNRRLEALHHIYGDSSGNHVPCMVMEEENDTEVGLHANMMREDMHPLDECDAIYALCADGEEDFDSVGKRFGQTTKWVKQRVTLSELSDKAKEMFRNHEFGIGVAMALTLGDKDAQDKFLSDNEGRSFTSGEDFFISAAWVRRSMTGEKVSASLAIVPIDTSDPKLVEMLGVESDLFSDDVYITNLEAFDEYQQNCISKMVQDYRDQGYMDVVYLKDEYWFDSPAVRGFTRVHEWDSDKYSPEDLIHVISYNTVTYGLEEGDMVSKETKAEEEKANEEPEEEIELSPMVMSKPQQDLLKGYYADFVKSCWWGNYSDYLPKLSMALLVHRRLGYTYSHINRVGNVYADYQNMFPPEERPDGYVNPEYENFIKQHVEACQVAFDNDGVAPLHYCLDLDTEELSKLFTAVVLTSLSKHDVQHETIKAVTPDFTAGGGWFKPDTVWLNKYKIEQIAMLEDYVFGAVKTGTKKERITALADHFASKPVFDPYGDWPQFKPQ